jgi:hypothetical protein
MQGDHWRVQPVDLADLFRALTLLDPPAAFVALADGSWSPEVRQSLTRISVDPGEAVRQSMWRDFRDAAYVPVSAASMAELVALAEVHAEPEMAIHVAALTTSAPLLEWFDLPDDPISLSPLVTPASVLRFVEECDTVSEWVPGGV